MILLAITPGLGFDRGRWEKVLCSGVDAFLIREKQLPARELLEAARWCQDRAPEVALWVAGRLDVAFAARCGLHAPEDHPDMEAEVDPGLVPLSRPLHAETQWASRTCAEQLLIAPVFASPGKGATWGVDRLHQFLDGLPELGPSLLALGGVDPSNAPALKHPRLAGIAAIRPFWEGDPEETVARFKR
jgi:thiamine monophosphate synthase